MNTIEIQIPIYEIAALSQLETSIINDGMIKPDEEGFFTCEEDRERTAALSALMDKYRYGWYIAHEPTAFDQLRSINQFKLYILSQYKTDI